MVVASKLEPASFEPVKPRQAVMRGRTKGRTKEKDNQELMKQLLKTEVEQQSVTQV